jgi:Ran GTPase-activating protein (RanGAP) involved in mRNA processing and transport
MESLAYSRNLENLTSLDLGGNDVGDDGAAVLAAFPALQGLESLNLWNASGYYSLAIRARGAMALAQSGMLSQLRYLNLNDHQIGDRGLREFALSEDLKGLRHLELQRNDIGGIGDAGLEALALSQSLTNLRYLDLSGNEIGVGGGRALAMWHGLEKCRFLGLQGCSIGDTGVRALAESLHIAGVREMNLGRNRIGDRGGQALLESPYLPRAVKIDLNGNLISPELRDALAERYRIDFD